MKVNVAASAPITPPETGASSISKSTFSASLDTFRAVSTSIVEQSINSGLELVDCRIPDVPKYTSRTSLPAGSMVMIISTSEAASVTSFATNPPLSLNLVMQPDTTSNPFTWWLALIKCAAIGPPILPKPINPILAILIPQNKSTLLH